MFVFGLTGHFAGCMLAGLTFRKEPFFAGADNVDQLYKIARVAPEIVCTGHANVTDKQKTKVRGSCWNERRA